MDKKQSITLNYLRFLLIIAVVVLHAYTITQTVEWLRVGHPVYKFLSYNLSLLLGNIGVPFFFFISGFLFYYNGKPNYFLKLKSRFYSLVIPYLLWNLLTILLYYFMQKLPFTEGLFSGFHQLVADYSWKDFLSAFWDCGDWNLGNGKPILTTYWYIRNLIVFVIVSPLIYELNTYLKFYWLIAAGVVWLLTPHVAFTASSIFCFGVGTYLGMKKADIKLTGNRYKAMLSVCLGLAVLLNYYLYYPTNSILPITALRLFIICAVPLIYTFVYQGVVKGWKIPQKFLDSAFFVYSFHIFFMMALRKLEIKLFPDASDGLSVFFYLTSVVITFLVSYGVYYLLNKFTPKFLSLLCGNRC